MGRWYTGGHPAGVREGILVAVGAPVGKLCSGGQTGVDRAALDVAMALGIPVGGWCPAGRRAEDGPLGPHYPLRETPSPEYHQRTQWNVRDSDATLIIATGPLTGGTALTLHWARAYGRPYQVADSTRPGEVARIRLWLEELSPGVLNVAGPRDDGSGTIYRQAREFLLALLAP